MFVYSPARYKQGANELAAGRKPILRSSVPTFYAAIPCVKSKRAISAHGITVVGNGSSFLVERMTEPAVFYTIFFNPPQGSPVQSFLSETKGAEKRSKSP